MCVNKYIIYMYIIIYIYRYICIYIYIIKVVPKLNFLAKLVDKATG